MSSHSRPKMFAPDKEGFRQRQAWALKRRMLEMGITAKAMAAALGNHPDTVSGWANGTATMCGDVIEAVDRYFQDRGDWTFFDELYGDLGARRIAQAQQLELRAKQLRATAEALGGPRLQAVTA